MHLFLPLINKSNVLPEQIHLECSPWMQDELGRESVAWLVSDHELKGRVGLIETREQLVPPGWSCYWGGFLSTSRDGACWESGDALTWKFSLRGGWGGVSWWPGKLQQQQYCSLPETWTEALWASEFGDGERHLQSSLQLPSNSPHVCTQRRYLTMVGRDELTTNQMKKLAPPLMTYPFAPTSRPFFL